MHAPLSGIWRCERVRLTLQFVVRCWGRANGALCLPGLQPFREVPDDRHNPAAALVAVQPVLTGSGRLALAGFLAGTVAWLVRPARWTCASSRPGAASARCPCSRSAVPASRPSRAIWGPAAVPASPSPGGCALSPGPASTRPGEEFLEHSRPCTPAGSGWIMSRTPPRWTAASSARSWPRRARAARRACPGLLAGAERAAGLRGGRRRHRAPRAVTRAPSRRRRCGGAAG
jgi:hypothetical protein